MSWQDVVALGIAALALLYVVRKLGGALGVARFVPRRRAPHVAVSRLVRKKR